MMRFGLAFSLMNSKSNFTYRASVRAFGPLILLILAIASRTSTSAQTTIGSITGVVTSISDPNGLAPSTIHVGDAVTTAFSYGVSSSTSAFDSQTTVYNFSSGSFSIQVSIGSLTWSYTTGTGQVTVANDHTVLNRDQYYVATSNISGTPASFPNAIQSSSLFVGLYDQTAPYDLVSGTSLPRATSDVNLAAANLIQGGISSFGSGGPNDQWQITYSVATLSLTSIPEPSTVALYFGTVALVATRYRRRILR
jgi:hypothetical protein